jgi:hypothetical protein
MSEKRHRPAALHSRDIYQDRQRVFVLLCLPAADMQWQDESYVISPRKISGIWMHLPLDILNVLTHRVRWVGIVEERCEGPRRRILFADVTPAVARKRESPDLVGQGIRMAARQTDSEYRRKRNALSECTARLCRQAELTLLSPLSSPPLVYFTPREKAFLG